MSKLSVLITSFVCALVFTGIIILGLILVKIVAFCFDVQAIKDMLGFETIVGVAMMFFLFFFIMGYFEIRKSDKKVEEFEKIIKNIEPESEDEKKEFYKTGIKIFSNFKIKL